LSPPYGKTEKYLQLFLTAPEPAGALRVRRIGKAESGRCNPRARRDGCGENPLPASPHLAGELPVDAEYGDFEVQPHRAVVEIGGADGRRLVVDEHDLLMHEARTVTVEPDTRLRPLFEVGVVGQIDEYIVEYRRYRRPNLI